MTKFQLFTIWAGINGIYFKNEDESKLWYECWLDGYDTAFNEIIDCINKAKK